MPNGLLGRPSLLVINKKLLGWSPVGPLLLITSKDAVVPLLLVAMPLVLRFSLFGTHLWVSRHLRELILAESLSLSAC